MAILFVTHKYPPATGGMEKFSFELYQSMQKIMPVHIIAYEGKTSRLLWFLQLKKNIRAMLDMHPEINIIHLNDGLMVSYGLWIKKFTGRKVVATLHGLDIVFPLPYFQQKILPKFNLLDGIACVSKAGKEAAIQRGIDPNKIVVINNGVDHNLTASSIVKAIDGDLYSRLHIAHDSYVITGMGRAVKRKGFSWFVANVLPHLPAHVVFVLMGPITNYGKKWWHKILPSGWVEKMALMMGSATDEENLKKYAKQYPNRFIRTGYLPFTDIEKLLQSSGAFVMPNISVEGDMEGFGLVALEAVLCGCFVFAANQEGITDAIYDHKNGFLLPAENTNAWIEALTEFIQNPPNDGLLQRYQEFTLNQFSWDKMARDYHKWFNSILVT